jgi:hypothetical protein
MFLLRDGYETKRPGARESMHAVRGHTIDVLRGHAPRTLPPPVRRDEEVERPYSRGRRARFAFVCVSRTQTRRVPEQLQGRRRA